MSIISNLLAKVQDDHPTTPAIKARELRCPDCGAVINTEELDDDAWRTADEAGETSSDDDSSEGFGDDSETLNSKMNTPKSRHDAEQTIARSLLKVSSERKHNDPNLPSVSKARKAVEDYAAKFNESPAELLARMLKQAKKDEQN